MIYLGAYFILGVVICAVVMIKNRKCTEDGISPLELLVDSHPLSFFVFLAFWPFLLYVQISDKKELERRKNRPVSEKIEKFDLLNHMGWSTTDLNPGGKVVVGKIIVDAVSESQFIKKDSAVKIVGTTPTGYVVRSDELPAK